MKEATDKKGTSTAGQGTKSNLKKEYADDDEKKKKRNV
jgi:hypothetical protein